MFYIFYNWKYEKYNGCDVWMRIKMLIAIKNVDSFTCTALINTSDKRIIISQQVKIEFA